MAKAIPEPVRKVTERFLVGHEMLADFFMRIRAEANGGGELGLISVFAEQALWIVGHMEDDTHFLTENVCRHDGREAGA